MKTKDVEYSQIIPNCSKFTLQCRGSHDVLIAFKAGDSGTTYFTVKSGTVYKDEDIRNGYNANQDVTVYAQCGTASQVLEITCWTK